MIYMIKTKKRCDNKINAYQEKMQEQMIDEVEKQTLGSRARREVVLCLFAFSPGWSTPAH